MNNILEDYKNNIPIFVLAFYTLGYIYLHAYYSVFDISIEYYINLTDIIFFIVSKLINITVAYFLLEFIFKNTTSWATSKILNLYVLNILKRRKNPEVFKRFLNININRKEGSLKIIILTFSLIVTSFILIHILSFPYRLYIYLTPYFLLNMYLINKKHFKTRLETRRILVFIAIFSVVISYFLIALTEAIDVKNKIDLKHIQFISEKTAYNTESERFNLIGETTDYMFMYDSEKINTLVFKKSEISNFIINTKPSTSNYWTERTSYFNLRKY